MCSLGHAVTELLRGSSDLRRGWAAYPRWVNIAESMKVDVTHIFECFRYGAIEQVYFTPLGCAVIIHMRPPYSR